MKELAKWCESILKDKDDAQSWNKLDQQTKHTLAPIRELIKDLKLYKQAINFMPNPVFLKDENTKVVFLNEEFEKLFGIKNKDFVGKKPTDFPFLSQEDKQKYSDEDFEILNNLSSTSYEVNIKNSNESKYAIYSVKAFKLENSSYLVGEVIDITNNKIIENKLNSNIKTLQMQNQAIQDEAMIDPLTKLFNRRAISKQVHEKILQAKNDEKNVYLLLADIDLFKNINDSYGHIAGDDVLVKFANIIQDSCRQEDICVRYGGDEFLIILFGNNYSVAQMVANRIVERVRDIKFKDGKNATTSIGMVEFGYNESFLCALARADNALYEAKRSGRNKTVAE